ncbi:MAG TPA: sensor domain-containing diguanylate cyclase [Chloroflexota bacterium]|nr:sensor domain-containing diguanylate cyclase [Chloroflexota bacterium]
MLLQAATITALASLVATVASWRKGRRLRADLTAAQRRLELLGAPLLDDAEEQRAVGASALRRDERRKFDADEDGYYRGLRKLLLADFRDVAGAEEAVFWRWNATNDGLEAESWSSDTPAPAHFDFAEWAPLVQWSAETGVIQTVGREDLVTVGAICVMVGETLLGVLTLTRADGLALPRPALKAWMPRMAAQLAAFHDLVNVRLQYGRHMRQGQALLDAVQRLQGDQSGEGLARALCETALDVSGARGTALVRWYGDADRGEIHYATAGTGLPTRDGGFVPVALGPRSLVAEACRNAAAQVLDDARGVATGDALYGVPRRLGDPGAVAIMPLTKEGRVLGALVIEAEAPAGLTLEETRPLEVLGAVVASSLELAWSYAEVDRKARTDALTGLFNRMHFGEQLQRTLAEADRHNQPLSLVLVDVDHFKKVNDSWGHEAGDAVLKHVARILQEAVRAVDVCARYGGEEMAILMSQTDTAGAVEVAERLRARLEATVIRHAGAEIAVTASFGVATYPETVKVKEQLFPSADKALYIAKHEGRNRVSAKPATKGKAIT